MKSQAMSMRKESEIIRDLMNGVEPDKLVLEQGHDAVLQATDEMLRVIAEKMGCSVEELIVKAVLSYQDRWSAQRL